MIVDEITPNTAIGEIARPYLSLFEKLTPLIGCHSEEEISRRACSLIASLVQVQACSILIAETSGHYLQLKAATHIPEEHWSSIQQPATQGAVGKVFQQNHPILIRTAEDFAVHFGRQPDNKYSSSSCVIVPVTVDELSIGVINIAHPQGRLAFDQRDVELLMAATRLIGAALHQAGLFNRNLQLRRDLQNMVNAIPAGVAVVDENLRLHHLNTRALVFFGSNAREGHVPHTLQEWLPAELHCLSERLIRHVRENHEPRSESLTLKKKASCREIRLLVSPLGGLLAMNDDMLLMIEDIGIEAELERLRQAESIKNSILSTLFHELRTPLAVIRGAVPLLQPRVGEPISPETQDQVYTLLSNNSKRLTDVVNTMLDVTEIENGSIALRSQSVDLHDMLPRVLEKHMPQMEGKSQKCEVKLTDDPVVVEGDERRLRQIFDELLANAVKFGAKDSVIQIQMDSNSDAVEILVSNDSKAIDEKEQSLIFQKFYQCDQSMTRSVGGIGLGLYLVQNLVHLHGGKIQYEDLGDQRVGFRVWFPRELQVAASADR